jgi:hypothetical protein
MHAEPTAFDEESTLNEPESATQAEASCDALPRVHNIMDVLYPAKPPEPKNARIIRLFDIEAAKTDPRPAADNVEKAQQERKNRDDARALRNRSLLAAAGLE